MESMNARQLWQAVLTDLESSISRNAFANWFLPNRPRRVSRTMSPSSPPRTPTPLRPSKTRYASQVERALSRHRRPSDSGHLHR